MSYLTDKSFLKGPSGFSSSKADLKYWAKRASDNSLNAARCDDKMHLHSTGGEPKCRSTSSPPKGFGADPYAKARGNSNHAGDSSYMKGVRRTVGGS
jgi:hypothetical protein